MDVLTHGFAPYAILTWLRRPRSHRAIAALGGIAPDLDTAFAWASHAHEYAYPLVHRGFSHTLWGAPLLATLALFLMSRPRLHRRWPRLGAFHWTPDALTPLWIGSMTHLLLDMLTITGVPLLWPFDSTRYTTNSFFFSIFLMLPFSLFALIRLARGNSSDAEVKVFSLILVAIVVASGVIRFGSLPEEREPASHLTPGTNDWTWYVTYRNETGTITYATGPLEGARDELYLPEHNRTQAAHAVEACRASPAYTAVKWDLWAPEHVNATRVNNDTWRIVFQDPAQLYAEHYRPTPFPRSAIPDDDDGIATCAVTDGGRVDFKRERGWFGS